MAAFLVALIAVPLLDQAVKLALLARLQGRSIRLGRMGHLRLTRTRMWMLRGTGSHLGTIWTLWTLAAAVLGYACSLFPVFGAFAGLVAGGALSHALETSLRGCVCDYVCLRFWPAFNLADLALTAGLLGSLWVIPALIRS